MGVTVVNPEVDMQIESEIIEAKTRKLKAVWTYEAAQDLRAWHASDQEQELADILAEELQQEIDKEILEDLRRNQYNLPWGFKSRRPKFRSLDDDWEVQKID